MIWIIDVFLFVAAFISRKLFPSNPKVKLVDFEPEFIGPALTKDGVEFTIGMEIWRVDSFVEFSWRHFDTGWVYEDKLYYYLHNGELCTKLHAPDIEGADAFGDHLIPVCPIVECYADRDKALAEALVLLDEQIASVEAEKRCLIEKIIR